MAETNIATEIARIQTDRNTIRTKLVELGMVDSAANLDDCASAITGIENRGAVSASVQEGTTYTIPKGYHNGSGTVSGISGGGNYSLQSKSVTPTKSQQNITPDSGYYGLSDVTVEPIPSNFQDVSATTAGAADVLTGKVFTDATGKVITGTMANINTVTKSLDTTTTSYTIPKGYHNGSGTVSGLSGGGNYSLQSKSVTPTKSQQNITPDSGYFGLSDVTVNAIPSNYQDVGATTTTAADVLTGKVFTTSTGVVTTGTMANNGAVTKTLSTSTTSYTIPKGYHSGSGKVSISTETKSATPTKSSQTITPTSGKVLSSVTVAAIPSDYITTTDATATAAQILDDATAYVKGSKVTGTMANNGSTSKTIDGLTSTSVTIPAGYTSGGTVSLTSDIEDALSAI